MTFMPETDSVGIFLQEYLVRKEMACEVRTVFVWLSEGRSGTVAYASAAREAGSLSAEHLQQFSTVILHHRVLHVKVLWTLTSLTENGMLGNIFYKFASDLNHIACM
jgi:hypothetical protein